MAIIKGSSSGNIVSQPRVAVDIIAESIKKDLGSSNIVSPPADGDGQAYKNLVLADSPVYYMRLGDLAGPTAVAEVGVNGTYFNTVVFNQTPGLLLSEPTAPSILLNSGAFAGVTFSTEIMVTGSTGWTIEMWVNPSQVSGTFQALLIDGGNQGVYIDGSRIAYFSSGIVRGGTTLVVGTIYHLVWTKDNTINANFYVNGVNDGLFTAASGNASFETCGYAGNPAEFHRGNLQDVSVYDYELTPTQVLAHYNAGI